MRNKSIIAAILSLLLFSFPLSADIIGSKDNWLMTHNSVNNEGFYWDMAQTIRSSSAENNFSEVSQDGLGLFRIECFSDQAGTVTITSPHGGELYFVSDDQPSVKRRFYIDVYEIMGVKTEITATTYNAYNASQRYRTLGAQSPISVPVKAARWTFYRTCSYSPGWGFYNFRYLGNTEWCCNVHYYDFKLYLPDVDASELVPGDYHATFYISCPAGGSGNGTITEQIQLKGHLGGSSGSTIEYSFIVNPSEDTYTVDLETYDSTAFRVAEVPFNCIGDAQTANSSTPPAASFADKYTVLVSASPNYNTDDPYRFIRYNTESQARTYLNTVYYSLGMLDSSQSPIQMANYSTFSNVYKLPLSYSYRQRGGGVYWTLNWSLPLTYITLTLDNSDIPEIGVDFRNDGLYCSYLYFTVITNT